MDDDHDSATYRPSPALDLQAFIDQQVVPPGYRRAPMGAFVMLALVPDDFEDPPDEQLLANLLDAKDISVQADVMINAEIERLRIKIAAKLHPLKVV